jgi:hypothetical protein
MKKKFKGILIVILVGLPLLYMGDLIAVEQPDDIMIDNEGYNPDRKGPVSFSHLNHSEDYEVTCMECHHEYQSGKNVWKEGDPVKKCAECHIPLENQGEVKKLQIAFHKNCKTCHKDLAQKGITKDAPYRQCNNCHEKKS